MEDLQEALTYIHPHKLDGVWKQVRPGIEEILRKCPDDDFTSEGVYWFLKENRASLFLLEDGFLVLEISTSPFNGTRTLCVWLLYWLRAEENQDWLCEQLEKIKRDANCQRVQFKSPRAGWIKKAKRFKLKMQTWEME